MNLPYLFKSIAVVLVLALSSVVVAQDDKKPNIEDLVEKPTGAPAGDLSNLKRASLTEEQAIAQLKYMMVNGFKKVEKQLLERGSFKVRGMTLDPDGTFRMIRVDGQDEMPQEIALDAQVRALKGLAAARTQWGVGLMYVNAKRNEEGGLDKRVIVTAEHIAGWARTWEYPYKVVDGQVKMGRPNEYVQKPVYFTPNQ